MSRSQYPSIGVIADRQRQQSHLREVGIPLYLPLPEAPSARETAHDRAEAEHGAEADIFVVWGDDEDED